MNNRDMAVPDAVSTFCPSTDDRSPMWNLSSTMG